MLTTLTLLAAMQAAPQALPQDAKPDSAAPRQTVLRVHSLESLLRRPGPTALPVVPPILHRESGAENFLLGGSPATAPSADLVATLIRQDLEVQGLEADLRLTTDRLLVTGPVDGVARVDRVFDYLARALTRRVSVTAALYRGSLGGALPADVGSAEFLAGLGTPVWTARTSLPSGCRTTLQRGRQVPYVADVDVEVAQNSDIDDPKIDVFFAGVQVVVEPHVLASGDVVLHGQFTATEELASMQARNPGGDARVSIDAPVVGVRSGTFSGRAAAGQGLVYVSRAGAADGGDVVLVVRVDAVSPAPEQLAELGVLPVSALLASTLRNDPVSPNAAFGGFQAPGVVERFGTEDGQPVLSRAALIDLLTLAGTDEVDSVLAVDVAGQAAVIEGDRARVERCRTVLAELERSLLVNVRPQLTTELPGDGGATLVHQVSIPSLVGFRQGVTQGVETTMIFDFDVEIAQKSAVSNPIVRGVFRGISAAVGVVDGAGGREADVRAVLGHHGDVRRRASEGDKIGDFWITDAEIAQFAWGGPVPDGGVVLGEGVAVDNGGKKTVQRVDIR